MILIFGIKLCKINDYFKTMGKCRVIKLVFIIEIAYIEELREHYAAYIYIHIKFVEGIYIYFK